ncbi:RGS domain-containing protein [Linnemannia elongata]|nr:RGS domain-containing protein [Linnemannia elongata]
MDLTYSSSSDDPRFQHLPNLWQVLHRKTQPPVCLFNFYLYMRDDEKSSEEVDFWLDVTAHEVLWRLYVRATKRRMAMAEREMRMERERYGNGTESGVSEGTSTGAHPPTPAAKRTPSKAGTSKSGVSGAGVPSSLNKDAGIAMTAGQRVGTDGTTTTKTTTTTENTGTGAGTGTGTGTVARAATATPRRAMTSGTGGVTKEDLQRSAERIYYKYLIPQAEKRVRIPGEVRQRVAMLMDSKMMLNQGGPNSTLQQPDQDLGLVFAEAREIVFEGMESYYFPRFLKARAYGNMVPSHRLMRCVTGLFFLFVGFAIVLSLIFLNIRPRSLRAWALIPIFIGAFLCTTFQFNICPILVAMGVSETKWMQFAKVKEPYLIKLHRRRGIKVVVVAVLYTVCAGIIFGAVPGHRL